MKSEPLDHVRLLANLKVVLTKYIGKKVTLSMVVALVQAVNLDLERLDSTEKIVYVTKRPRSSKSR